MHILVTGADGFIGKHIVRRALQDGHEVIALTRRPRHPSSKNINALSFDLLKPESWERALCQAKQIDAVIHLAAIMPEAATATPEDFDLGNRQFTRYLYDRVAEAASATPVNLVPLLYFSSIGVIGEATQDLIDEKYTPAKEDLGALHPYFAGKLGGEEEIRKQSGANLSAFIFRLTSPYGALMGQKSVLPHFIDQARAGKHLFWHGSGTRTQDFIFVDDIAEICMKAVAVGRTEQVQRTLYLASGARISMKGLASMIAYKGGVSASVSGQVDPQEHRIWGVNNTALKETLGLSKMTPLSEGIDHYIASLDRTGANADLVWWKEER